MPSVNPENEFDVCFATIIGDGAIVSYSKVPTPSVAVKSTVDVVVVHVIALEVNAKSVGESN